MKTGLYRRTVLAIFSLGIIFTLVFPVHADTTVLKKGVSSPEVKEAQAALKELGFFNNDCTGYFGEITEAAVKNFQKAHKLDDDGVLGPATISLLNKLTGENIKLPSRQASSRKDTTKVNVRYKIKKGDTIWDIAGDYNVSVSSILEYNGLEEDAILTIGKEIIIPNVVKVVKPAPEGNASGAEAAAEVPVQDSSELANIYEHNKNIYVVKDGDSFESIAEDFGVTAEAILNENSLTDGAVPIIGQEIKIPEGDDVVIRDDPASSPGNNGEYLDWFKEVQYIFEKGDIATVTDVETGKSFRVKRLYGRNHADCEPMTAEDTEVMKDLYGSWSWNRRAVIVTVTDKKDNERKIAASMNGMPHGGESIGSSNKFKGHFCIHFKNSRTHSGSRLDASHQKAVKLAAGIQ